MQVGSGFEAEISRKDETFLSEKSGVEHNMLMINMLCVEESRVISFREFLPTGNPWRQIQDSPACRGGEELSDSARCFILR